MSRSLRRVLTFAIGSLTVMAAGPIFTGVQASEGDGSGGHRNLGGLAGINHLVVIYDENRSFDNLYGFFPGANGLDESGDDSAKQIDRVTGRPYACLPQTDPTLVAYLDQGFAVVQITCREMNFAACGGELDRVRDQVVEGLQNAVGVSPDVDAIGSEEDADVGSRRAGLLHPGGPA